MNAKNQAIQNVLKIQRLERELAKEAAKVAARDMKLATIKKLARDTAGDPLKLLQQIAKMFEVEQ